MNSLAKIGCALATLGLVGCGDVAEAPGQRQPSAKVGQFERQMRSLQASLKQNAKQIEKLTALARANQVQLRQLARRSAGNAAASVTQVAAAPAPVDPAVLRELVRENIREFFAQVGRKLKLPLTDLPPAVRETLLKTIPGIQIRSVEQKTDDGWTFVRIKGKFQGEGYELKILLNGEILEADLLPEKAPQVVRDAASRMIPGLRLTQVEQLRRNDGVLFRVEGRLGKEKFDLRIAADGTVLEAELPLEHAPQFVRDAVAIIVPGMSITKVELNMNDGEVVFDVEGKFGRKKYDLRIAADGTVLEAELPPEHAPQLVRDALVKIVPGISATRIELNMDDGKVVFDVRGKLGKKKIELRIAADGTVLEAELPLALVPRVILQAARNAVPGIDLDDEVDLKTRDGEVVYDFKGEVGDQDYELRISEAGVVLRVEVDGELQKIEPQEVAPQEGLEF